MIEIKLCRDEKIIKPLFTSDDIYPYVSDDVSCSKEEWEPNFESQIWLVVLQNHIPVGFVLLDPRSKVLTEMHIGFLSNFRRRNWKEAGKLFFDVVQDTLPYRKLVGMIPEYNRPALFIANKFGFKREGKITDSVLKNGQVHNLIIVGRTLEWDKKDNHLQK